MTYSDAIRLLDRVKDGVQFPDEVVAEALAMTGEQHHATQVPCPEIEDFVQALREAGQL
ncbi:hypothetical protein UFOVP417_22 [uncultured Caudovirales phage]|uniref:Uncharacterized protein n=1 Tax=uncultured Caudovirales phage TaxID=2100421 RepID=A0A6J5M466_9CAUD|nr:hypothetical protein UFOVP417_22 [uncultured Caudovirales phage]